MPGRVVPRRHRSELEICWRAKIGVSHTVGKLLVSAFDWFFISLSSTSCSRNFSMNRFCFHRSFLGNESTDLAAFLPGLSLHRTCPLLERVMISSIQESRGRTLWLRNIRFMFIIQASTFLSRHRTVKTCPMFEAEILTAYCPCTWNDVATVRPRRRCSQ